MNKNPQTRIKPVTRGATAATGFVAAGVSAELRYEGRRDLGLLLSEVGGGASAVVVTTNVLKSAPLLVTKGAVETGDVRALAGTSGTPTEATGPRGGGAAG